MKMSVSIQADIGKGMKATDIIVSIHLMIFAHKIL